MMQAEKSSASSTRLIYEKCPIFILLGRRPVRSTAYITVQYWLLNRSVTEKEKPKFRQNLKLYRIKNIKDGVLRFDGTGYVPKKSRLQVDVAND